MTSSTRTLMCFVSEVVFVKVWKKIVWRRTSWNIQQNAIKLRSNFTIQLTIYRRNIVTLKRKKYWRLWWAFKRLGIRGSYRATENSKKTTSLEWVINLISSTVNINYRHPLPSFITFQLVTQFEDYLRMSLESSDRVPGNKYSAITSLCPGIYCVVQSSRRRSDQWL